MGNKINIEKFIEIIEIIGFKYNSNMKVFIFGKYRIFFFNNSYNLWNGYENVGYLLSDLSPLKKISRSYKLKKLIG